jgi:hypothetical protein
MLIVRQLSKMGIPCSELFKGRKNHTVGTQALNTHIAGIFILPDATPRRLPLLFPEL